MPACAVCVQCASMFTKTPAGTHGMQASHTCMHATASSAAATCKTATVLVLLQHLLVCSPNPAHGHAHTYMHAHEVHARQVKAPASGQVTSPAPHDGFDSFNWYYMIDDNHYSCCAPVPQIALIQKPGLCPLTNPAHLVPSSRSKSWLGVALHALFLLLIVYTRFCPLTWHCLLSASMKAVHSLLQQPNPCCTVLLTYMM